MFTKGVRSDDALVHWLVTVTLALAQCVASVVSWPALSTLITLLKSEGTANAATLWIVVPS